MTRGHDQGRDRGPGGGGMPLAIDGLRHRDHVSSADVDAFLGGHESPIVEGDAATFLFRGDADAVAVTHRVVGLPPTLTMRRVDDSDLWYVVEHLPAGSRVEYRLQVTRDGQVSTINDPHNPHVAHNPMGTNSVARATGYEPPDWIEPDPETRPGSITELAIDSAALGRTVQGHLYLPARFTTTRRYPVVIIHDGSDYLQYTSAKTVLDNLIHRLDVAELVAMFIDPKDRLVEYANNPDHTRFLADELLPQLEADLPLLARPRGRCLMGASFGGIASFSAAVARPDTFGSLLLESASFAVLDIGDDFGGGDDGDVFRPVVDFIRGYRAEPIRVVDRMYITCGAYEPMIRGNRAMVPTLRATGTEVRYVEARDGHNWENWRDRLRDGLSWLFPGPQEYVYE